jgi:membrane protein DedA with SNARE-associated domain
MLNLVIRHSFVIICLAVFLEELGIPMPIPTDILIIFAGTVGGRSLPKLMLWFILLSIASALGSSGLYLVVRRGGRPLVERFGRYVHLGPEQLARAERILERSGWFGIAAGRAIPGLRYVTVIACGLLRVPYRRYLTAHLAGSSVYIIAFLALGSIFGRGVIDQIQPPELAMRLLWLLALALGLPLLLGWLCFRGHARHVAEPSRRRQLSALIVASLAGTTAMSATWAGAATLSEMLGAPRSLDMSSMLANWLLDRGLRTSGTSAYMLVYASLLLVCVAVGVAYYELIQPHLATHNTSLSRQALGLVLLSGGVVAGFFSFTLMLGRIRPLERWWQAGGWLLLLAIGVGVLSYTLTTVYGRALAIAILPSLRRSPPKPAAHRRMRRPDNCNAAPAQELPEALAGYVPVVEAAPEEVLADYVSMEEVVPEVNRPEQKDDVMK